MKQGADGLWRFLQKENGDWQKSPAWDEEKKIRENLLLMLVLGLAAALEQK